MGFYFGSKLRLSIEGKDYEIDVHAKKVIKSVEEIAKKSAELSANEDRSKEDIEKYIKQLIQFIDTVTNDQTKAIFKDREITLEDLSELVAYILSEITKFKTDRLKSLTTAGE